MDLLKQYQLYTPMTFESRGKEISSNDFEMISSETITRAAVVETNDFRKRLKIFNSVQSLSEAKIIAKKYFPTNKEITSFRVDGGICTVVSNENMFRISFDSSSEFISYSFE